MKKILVVFDDRISKKLRPKTAYTTEIVYDPYSETQGEAIDRTMQNYNPRSLCIVNLAAV